MAEAPSDTSDYQRFSEMLVHLTPQGASVPYNVCYDSNGDIWVASKGGLYKFDGKTRKVLFKRKNPFPKKMAAFCQVVLYEDTIMYTSAECKDNTTQLVFLKLDGTETHSQFIDGLSLVVNSKGDLYITKQLAGEESSIYTTSFDAPLGWDVVVSDSEHVFETLGLVDDDTLFVSTVHLPKNMYSKQALRLVDVEEAKTLKTFSKEGREAGQIHFPRTIRRLGDHMIVLDKSGRFQRFTPQGEYVDTIAEVDAYLANGFAIAPRTEGETQDRALTALSGVVRDTDSQAICDDWLEFVPFDGSSWKEKRKAQ